MSDRSTPMPTQRTSVIKVGSIAAFLVAACLAIVVVSFSVLTGVSQVSDEATAATFLSDLAKHQDLVVFVVFMEALTAVVLVPLAAGLYEGLSSWNATLLGVTRIALIITAVLLAVSVAFEAPIAGYIVPAWAGAADASTQVSLAATTTTLSWAGDAISSLANLFVGIGIAAASIAMVQHGRQWWRVLGWVGIVGGAASLLSAFMLLASAFEIVSGVTAVMVFIWLLGACVGLWQMTAVSPSAAEITTPSGAAITRG